MKLNLNKGGKKNEKQLKHPENCNASTTVIKARSQSVWSLERQVHDTSTGKHDSNCATTVVAEENWERKIK